jgi:hypothetical protein
MRLISVRYIALISVRYIALISVRFIALSLNAQSRTLIFSQ